MGDNNEVDDSQWQFVSINFRLTANENRLLPACFHRKRCGTQRAMRERRVKVDKSLGKSTTWVREAEICCGQ